ncbi:hypothetical protein WJX73_010509 [Symbiochloris irregularis]|uniref:BLOC-1-related complex subunit 8 homolog n=1 Tax=Symbiochloris irregularis TaxID=706552 RepID=A0AAW1NWX0_9CHLO
MHKQLLAEGPWSLTSYLPFAKQPEGTPLDIQVRQLTEVAETIPHQLVHHPSVGLFYIREHVQSSASSLLQVREQNQANQKAAKAATYAADSCITTARQLKSTLPEALSVRQELQQVISHVAISGHCQKRCTVVSA